MAKQNANDDARKVQKTVEGKGQVRHDVPDASRTYEENGAGGKGGAKRADTGNAYSSGRTSDDRQGNQSNSYTEIKATKKEVAKAYEKYASQFTPKPKYFMNSVKAFITGGLICAASLWMENKFIASGMPEKEAATFVVIILVMLAQLLTGLGWFDTIGKHVGAGVIVPITGFANSMVAPAIEYKKEGIILGVGAKLFSLAGPVLVSGITASLIIGVIYWAMGLIR